MVWSMMGHTRPRSNAARLLADPMRKARVASCGLGRCGCAFRPCKRTIGGQEPSMSPRTPRTLQARAAWRRRHHRNRRPPRNRIANGTSPPRRDPPPGPHLRENQVGDARKCPRNFAAIPRRDLTCARSRLGTAKKRTVISNQGMPRPLRRGAKQWGKVTQHPAAFKRSRAARRPHAQSAGGKL